MLYHLVAGVWSEDVAPRLALAYWRAKRWLGFDPWVVARMVRQTGQPTSFVIVAEAATAREAGRIAGRLHANYQESTLHVLLRSQVEFVNDNPLVIE